jgi:anaerobic magnesium-protoporphyrin IX monomethyl ester cyclase
MTDCLIIGFNDFSFTEQVQMVRSMGMDSGAFQDLNLAFIEYEGKPYRSIDILNRFYFEDKPHARRQFSNVDFLWPVVQYLGTYLHRRGLSFDYVNLFHLEKDKLKDKLLHDDILTIAITTTLYVTVDPILEIIAFIKQYNEKVRVVVGGPYIQNQTKMLDPTSLQQQFKYIGADYYVISQEGEATLVNLLNTLKHGTSLDRVDNLAYYDGNKYVFTATSIESNPLEENMVDFSLFPREDIDQFVSLRTAKSCPFSCAFCGFPQRAGKYKYIGVDLIEETFNALNDLGVTAVTILDDTANVPKPRFREILQMMIRNKYDFKFNCFYRSDHGDEDTIGLMAKARCEGVFLGVESGSDQMLARMNKTSRRRNYMEAIPLLQAAGISAHANLVVGFPGETYQTVQESVSLIEETRPDFFRAQLWYADPMTPIWNDREKYGIQGSSFHWAHDTMDSKTACDLIDRIYLSVENSIWMPQNGFEQWSTFYLQRKGMSLDKIKAFMKCFNAAVKEKVINPNKREIDPQLLKSLQASCKFDRQENTDMRPVEIRSARGYKEAEAYWIKEFGDNESFSALETLNEGRSDEDDGQKTYLCNIDPELIFSLRRSFREGLEKPILAAFSILLSRLSGREAVALIAATHGSKEKGVIPLKLRLPWDLDFISLAKQVGTRIEVALAHNLYGLSILTNEWRMRQHGAVPPKFNVGYWYTHSCDGLTAILQEAGRVYPDVIQGIDLALKVEDDGNDIKMGFLYRNNLFGFETCARLGTYLELILKEACASPGIKLGDIALGGESARTMAMAIIATEEFNF